MPKISRLTVAKTVHVLVLEIHFVDASGSTSCGAAYQSALSVQRIVNLSLISIASDLGGGSFFLRLDFLLPSERVFFGLRLL